MVMRPPRLISWCALTAIGVNFFFAHAIGQQVFRSSTKTVSVYATVTAADGRPVMNLTVTDFEIDDDGQPAGITVFDTTPQPLTLLLMFDTSASLANNLDNVRLAATACVAALKAGDRARLGTFGHEIAISPHLTGDKSILARVIREEIWPGVRTRLWDGLHLGLSGLAGETGRRALIVLSDGRDSSSRHQSNTSASRAAVRAAATADDWSVYAVNVATGIDRALVEIVNDTGGRAVRTDRPSGLATAYAGVMNELRHQYLLGFAAAQSDGAIHTIDVRVRRPGLTVRARRVYRADGVAK
jgi:VWFA-related protein